MNALLELSRRGEKQGLLGHSREFVQAGYGEPEEFWEWVNYNVC